MVNVCQRRWKKKNQPDGNKKTRNVVLRVFKMY
jgi:hypothetical protein